MKDVQIDFDRSKQIKHKPNRHIVVFLGIVGDLSTGSMETTYFEIKMRSMLGTLSGVQRNVGNISASHSPYFIK